MSQRSMDASTATRDDFVGTASSAFELCKSFRMGQAELSDENS